MQIFAIVVSFALTVAAVALLVPAVRRMLGVIRSGQPAPGRTGNPSGRAVTMLKETFLHTRMLQWHWVGIMHWFVYAAFLFLSTAVLAAYFQLFDPSFVWPVVGHWYPFEWFSELIGLLSTVGIVYLIVYRQKHHPRSEGRRSRFFGSSFWQAYFVEALALLEGAAILFVRGAEYNLGLAEGHETATRAHFPIASFVGDALYPSGPDSVESLENIIFFIAAFKIALAMIWLMVIARNITMGIAWHRFTAWFNIYFKREDDGSTALGAMKPLTSGGRAITLDDIDELDEDTVLGVGSAEDFSWKGILDFTTCTECGRCQSQCPAWNTEKPLSPKLLVTSLRDHAYAKHDGDAAHTERALVGAGAKGETAGAGTDVVDWFYNPTDGDFVIDEDVLWSCTSCGACVQQCPVDIEHVDHIMDMRRYQLLVENNFPAELNQLFKGLEGKGNPWSASPTGRLDWAKGLDFEVKVVGEDLESLESVDWLFWVGCAGAYEDRAKKTTRAVAELLDMAGVTFGVLGNGETCTGDPARRAGNEFVFQGLAQQNVETFQEYKVKKVVSTCAHCFNTLKNEYKDLGIELEVVHHTQLLNRLVREGKLTPVKDGAGAAKRSITYHDPCYLGRHNQVYAPPRELLQVLPGAEVIEMERNSERSFCCGAGGARMWMEENLGERINMNRTKEAVGTGADQIAVGCPFCRVMLSDGLTMQQSKGEAREEVEVLDVAQMLLASVKGEPATKAGPGAAAPAAAGATATATATAPTTAPSTATSTPEAPAASPAPAADSGSSLFDTPAPTASPSPEATPEPTPAAAGGGSLFDTPAPEAPSADTAEEPAEEPATAKAADPFAGGSLFDTPAPAATETAAAPAPAAEPAPAPAPAPAAEPATTTDLGAGGSLFDLGTPDPAPAPAAPAPATEEAPAAKDAAAPALGLGAGGSLFDIAAPEPALGSESPGDSGPTTAPSEPDTEVESPSDSSPTTASTESDTEVESPSDSASTPAPAPAGGTVSTPATDADLTSLGSLFDLEAPTPQAAPAEAVAAPAAEPVTEQAEAEQPAPEPVAEQPVPEPVAEQATTTATSTVSTPATDVDLGGLGSLFDLEAPATSTAPTSAPVAEPATTADPDPEPATTADPEPEPEPESEPESEAAPEAAPEPAPGPEATEPTDEVVEEQPAEDGAPAAERTEQATPAPRTDVDISGASSLFDL